MQRGSIVVPLALALAGGYADAAGYLLAGCFTGHVTGNTVLFALSLADKDHHQVIVRLAAIFCFLAATFVGIRVAQRMDNYIRISVLLVEMFFILIAPSGLLLGKVSGPLCLIVSLCIALGLQNGAFRKYGDLGLHTTYLTGTITSMLVRAEPTAHGTQNDRELRKQQPVRTVLLVWLCFASGAGVAAYGIHQLGARAIWLLEAPLLFLCCIDWRQQAEQG